MPSSLGRRLLPATAIAGAASAALAAPASAQGLIATHRIPAALAAEAVTEAVAHCAGQGYAETAVLVDADGVTQAVLRGDRAGSHYAG